MYIESNGCERKREKNSRGIVVMPWIQVIIPVWRRPDKRRGNKAEKLQYKRKIREKRDERKKQQHKQSKWK